MDYFVQGISGWTHAESMYRLQPICKMGVPACSSSLEIGADYIATGHYAQRSRQLPNGRYAICKSATAAKDQTYALYNLTQHQLAHTLMPVGEYMKDKIREMAEEIGLPVAHKPDSQEICFVPDNDYAKFIEENSDWPD